MWFLILRAVEVQVFFQAYKKLGNSGKIVGIDLASKMLYKTKIEIENLGVSNIDLYEMDVEELNFSSNEFDIALCGFGLFYFPDLKKALREIYRVLKPEGVFVASTLVSKGYSLEIN